jgi:hypothetical protein
VTVTAAAGTEGLRVTHVLYAGDLNLAANDPVQLQEMLNRLELYAVRKGFAYNECSEILIVNSNVYQNYAVFPVFRLYNQELVERDNLT